MRALFVLTLTLFVTACGVVSEDETAPAATLQTSSGNSFIEVEPLCSDNPAFAGANKGLCEISNEKNAQEASLFVNMQAVCMMDEMATNDQCQKIKSKDGVYQVTPKTIFASTWYGVDHQMEKISGRIMKKLVPSEEGNYVLNSHYAALDYCKKDGAAAQDKLLCAAMDPVAFPISLANAGTARTVDADLDLRIFFGVSTSSSISDTEYWRLYAGIADFIASVKETISNQFGVEVETKDFVIIQADINGFTDPRGPAFYNLSLSKRRAQSAARFVADVVKQIGLKKIGGITIAGQGEKPNICPKSFNKSRKLLRACYAGQRSTELVLKFRVDIP